jgi:hypothetical protein
MFSYFLVNSLTNEKKAQLCRSVLFIASSRGAELSCLPVLLCQVERYPPHPEEISARWRIDRTVAKCALSDGNVLLRSSWGRNYRGRSALAVRTLKVVTGHRS